MGNRTERARAARDLLARSLGVSAGDISFVNWRNQFVGDDAVVVRVREVLWVADPYSGSNGAVGLKRYTVRE